MNNYAEIIKTAAEDVVSRFVSKDINSLQEGFDNFVLPNQEFNDNVKQHIATEINKTAYCTLYDLLEDKTFEFPTVKFNTLEKVANYNLENDSFYDLTKQANESLEAVTMEPISYDIKELELEVTAALNNTEGDLSVKSVDLTNLESDVISMSEELLNSKDDAASGFVITKVANYESIQSFVENNFTIGSSDQVVNEESSIYKLASKLADSAKSYVELDSQVKTLKSNFGQLTKIAEDMSITNDLDHTALYKVAEDINQKYIG
jgi:uncharacterized membrane-anchored protein YjiN (DUF445 family)